MMKPVIGFFLVLVSFTAIAQNRAVLTFSGRVTDALSGEPLSGTSIYFTDARIGAIADSNGRFFFRNVPPGHHLLEISHTGYTTIVDHIDLASSSLEKNFTMSPSIVEHQGVTVTGVTSATSTRTTPSPVNIIRKSQLLQTPSNNIVDALTRLPGISQISTGPAISKPVIRGLSYNRVVVVNDGVRQEGQQWGDEHGIEIDELSINRVEVLKGPASIMYGSDALAGVVNLITNQPVAEGLVKANIYSNYQTNNHLVGLNGNVAGNINGFNWNAYASSKSAMDYKNKYDGRVLNSRFNEKNFGGYVGINKGWGFSHLIFSRFNQDVGVVEGDRDDDTGEFLVATDSPLEHIATSEELTSRDLFTPYQGIRHTKIASDNSFRVGQGRIKLNLGYQVNQRKEFGNPEEPEEVELAFDLSTLNYNLQWRLKEKDTWQTTVGFNGMLQSNENNGEEVIIPEYGLFDIGGFIFSQKTYKDFTFTGGLRYDHRNLNSDKLELDNEVKFEQLEKNFSNISGSLGLSYHPTDAFLIKANFARGFRAPSLSELASNGAHEGTNRYEYGEPGLNSETSLQMDLGLEVDYEHFSFSLSGFYNNVNDFIYYSRLSSASGGDSIVVVDGEDLEAFRFNQQNASLSGLEASFDFHPHPVHWLHFENTISLIRGRFHKQVDGSDNLPMIPAGRWVSELRANVNKASNAVRNLYFKVEMDNTFEQNRPFFGYNTETSTKGYALLNAGFGMDIFSRGKPVLNFHISGNNLTDEAYQNHLNRLKYTAINNATGRRGVFNMGRNFSFKLNIPLEFHVK